MPTCGYHTTSVDKVVQPLLAQISGLRVCANLSDLSTKLCESVLKVLVQISGLPSTEPVRAGGLDGSAAAEERDNFHRDAHMNDRNHASGAPRPGCE